MLIKIQSSTESGEVDGVVVIEYARPLIGGIIESSAGNGGLADRNMRSKSANVTHLSRQSCLRKAGSSMSLRLSVSSSNAASFRKNDMLGFPKTSSTLVKTAPRETSP